MESILIASWAVAFLMLIVICERCSIIPLILLLVALSVADAITKF